MLGEQDLRDLSCTGACTVIVCAGMCHLAQQYWLGKGDRREECALDTSKRRFAERMWSLVTQVRAYSRSSSSFLVTPALQQTVSASSTGFRYGQRSC